VFEVLLAAASVCGTFALWVGLGDNALGVRTTRCVPDGTLRSATPERFHVELDGAPPTSPRCWRRCRAAGSTVGAVLQSR
jgi:hypothetical protein